MGGPRSFLVVSTLLGQIESAENFTQMMVKYYTRIIHREIKKGLPGDIFYLSILCKPMNYNRLVRNFSIDMQILKKKSLWYEFSIISRNNSLRYNMNKHG